MCVYEYECHQPQAKPTPADLVERVASHLGASYEAIVAAQRIASMLVPHSQGRNPMTIAAAALYLNAPHLGLAVVSASAGISVGTLRKMCNSEGALKCTEMIRAQSYSASNKRVREGDSDLSKGSSKLWRVSST